MFLRADVISAGVRTVEVDDLKTRFSEFLMRSSHSVGWLLHAIPYTPIQKSDSAHETHLVLRQPSQFAQDLQTLPPKTRAQREGAQVSPRWAWRGLQGGKENRIKYTILQSTIEV